MTENSRKTGSELSWVPTNEVTVITSEDLHIWRLSLDWVTGSNLHLWSLLSDDERERAQRFVRSQDQEKFVQVRGSLRVLLGQYLDRAGKDLGFEYGDYGKPELALSCNPINLQFNVSHSHALALIAVTRGIAVGIDVEHVNTKVDFRGISDRFFAAVEHQAVLQQPVDRQRQVFFQLWTRKEACIKAMGGSIAHALDQVSVAQGLDQPRITVSVIDQARSSQQLHVHNLCLGKEYSGAVATPQFLPTLHLWQWQNHEQDEQRA